MAQGRTPHGSAGVEKMVPAAAFVEELDRRGITVAHHVTLS